MGVYFADWVRARTKKLRTYHHGDSVVVRSKPSTAELRRWLHDAATPRSVKCRIYDILLYRRQVGGAWG